MIIEVRIPSPGESITEVEIANWLVDDGDMVKKDQEIAEIESDKATLPLIAEESGKIKIIKNEGDMVKVDTIVCEIDTDAFAEDTPESNGQKKTKDDTPDKSDQEKQKPKEGANKEKNDVEEKKENKVNAKEVEKQNVAEDEKNEYDKIKVTPVAKKLMEEHDINVNDIIRGLKKIGKKEVKTFLHQNRADHFSESEISRNENRQKMSSLRRKLSARLVAVKNETAMLTTFNEIDMSSIIKLRKNYQEAFTEKHGIKLGFMSVFTKAVVEALKVYTRINSQIDQGEIVTPEYYDIGIAVQTDKGLMVPVIRNAETKDFASIEKEINELARKARNNRLSIDEMKGGTFTITNGGIFGSLMSTPLINPPQSAILGMHNIQERPVAINGKVEIRPMMYVALSYDHRLIDGKESVSFLVMLKELIEAPYKMIMNGQDPDKLLLNLNDN